MSVNDFAVSYNRIDRLKDGKYAEQKCLIPSIGGRLQELRVLRFLVTFGKLFAVYVKHVKAPWREVTLRKLFFCV